jgi:hypothetical protein
VPGRRAILPISGARSVPVPSFPSVAVEGANRPSEEGQDASRDVNPYRLLTSSGQLPSTF